jgi:hypothetical protein
MANITNQSYFVKRLKDSGYVVWKIFDKYSEIDPRQWTVCIDPELSSIFCTYYVNGGLFGDETFFELYDGGQYVPSNVKLKTSSIEIIIQYLMKWGIHNKHEGYEKK